MDELWQNILTGLLVLAAAGYLTWRVYRFLARGAAPSCAGCRKCAPPSLVSLDSNPMREPENGSDLEEGG